MPSKSPELNLDLRIIADAGFSLFCARSQNCELYRFAKCTP